MTKIVNLGKVRKERDRRNKEETAAVNRVKFGRTKAERRRESAENDRKERLLDGKGLEE
ncbi:MAG: DUF4169 family protein [Rhodospirillales bacterium]|nr:DUF4169 family protein [Rhodospirillales bacterium]MCW8862735.1 DUF4169 family protein [Rhodospirillales bacterium]MCW8952472.1 DUF4169 family protein [Rhodospirillales bacterium]MCW8971043.1 DUF4169 family protein [Rhodospirillales bacterium]MCW9002126.1 DUF4169 family protein [Rhodospirillales bacterium]